MGIVLITQKTDALFVIALAGVMITLLQVFVAWGGFQHIPEKLRLLALEPGSRPSYASGVQRAHDEARQRGIADLVNQLLDEGRLVKFNVEPYRIRRLIRYTHNVSPEYLNGNETNGHEHFPEPSISLDEVYQATMEEADALIADIEYYSHYGIFTFIDKYYHNWVNHQNGRGPDTVQQAMISILFPLTDREAVWQEFQEYKWLKQPEPIWQFSRKRYQWAKDQWPNLSGRITTIWTLQDLGLVPEDVDLAAVLAITSKKNDIEPADSYPDEHTVDELSDG